MEDQILNNWRFLHAKSVELSTLTKALSPDCKEAFDRAIEIANEIKKTSVSMTMPEGIEFNDKEAGK